MNHLNKNKIFVIADIHYGHKNGIEIYSYERNWNLADYNREIRKTLSNLNYTDTLISLGDNCFGLYSEWNDFVKSLHCQNKFTVVGNHDKGKAQLENNGWKCANHWLTLKTNEETYIFCHQPMNDKQYDAILEKYPNGKILCGHMHYSHPLKLKEQMICLENGVMYNLHQIDELFNILNIDERMKHKTGFYVSAAKYKQIMGLPLHPNAKPIDDENEAQYVEKEQRRISGLDVNNNTLWSQILLTPQLEK